MLEMSPPHCVGAFEVGDPICNGDPKGRTEQDRMPCAWRNRCAGLQIYCGERGFPPAEVVSSLEYPGLVTLCENYAARHRISSGQVDGPPEDAIGPAAPEESAPKPAKPPRATPRPSEKLRKPPRAKNRRKGSNENATRLRPLSEAGRALVDHLERLLRDLFPERAFSTGNRVLVRSGTLYRIDRLASSRSLSWYCTSGRGRDVALIHIRANQNGTGDIRLPVAVDELKAFLGKHALKKLKPIERRNGQFLCICRGLNMEGVALCAETVRRLTEAEILILPATR